MEIANMDNNRSMDEFDLFQYEISQPPEDDSVLGAAKRSGIVAFDAVAECRQRIADLAKAPETDPLDAEAEFARLRIQKAIAEPLAPQTFTPSGQPLSKALSPDPAPAGDDLMKLLMSEREPDPDPFDTLENAADIRPGGGIAPPRTFAKRASGESPSILDKPLPQMLAQISARVSGEARTLAQKLAEGARSLA
jgi:hypothetical protein